MNKNLFTTTTQTPKAPPATAVNSAGGKAYTQPAKETLANMVSTATFNDTFYRTGEQDLNKIKEQAALVDDLYLAQLAVYAFEKSKMKDAPAVLFALLYERNPDLAKRVFPRIATNGKMLRNVATTLMSGVGGKKRNLASAGIRKLFQGWFDRANPEKILRANMGNEPTLEQLVKMTHPVAKSPEMDATIAWVIGKGDKKAAQLPGNIAHFEAWRKDRSIPMPNVPFEMLTGQPNLTEAEWKQIALKAGWHATRMNLNTFARHGVFKDKEVTKAVAAKLRDPNELKKNKLFPYQLYIAFVNMGAEIPAEIKLALQDALDYATRNVPSFADYDLFICPDVSGSMKSGSVTGQRGTATSKVLPTDVASLTTACFLRANKSASVLPFDTRLHSTVGINPNDSLMTIASRLAQFGGGGTACHLPLEHIAQRVDKSDQKTLVVMVSDYESWFGNTSNGNAYYGGVRNPIGSVTAQAWERIRNRRKNAKMVCIDTTANATVQVLNDHGVMNFSGFGDRVFDLTRNFVDGKTSFVQDVESIDLGIPQVEEDEEAVEL